MALTMAIGAKSVITTRAASTPISLLLLLLLPLLLLLSICSECTVLLEAFLNYRQKFFEPECATGKKSQPCRHLSISLASANQMPSTPKKNETVTRHEKLGNPKLFIFAAGPPKLSTSHPTRFKIG